AGTGKYGSKEDVQEIVKRLEADMKAAASALDFETAARIRDELFEIRAQSEGTTVKSRGSLAGIKAAG
ncbi:MAG: UvrB/UvrC motif-containing protein, partial [Gemmatimonadaceae bacterium]